MPFLRAAYDTRSPLVQISHGTGLVKMYRCYSIIEAAYLERLEGVLQTHPDKKILHVSLTPRVTGVDIFGQVAKWYAKNESRQDREKLNVRRSGSHTAANIDGFFTGIRHQKWTANTIKRAACLQPCLVSYRIWLRLLGSNQRPID